MEEKGPAAQPVQLPPVPPGGIPGPPGGIPGPPGFIILEFAGLL